MQKPVKLVKGQGQSVCTICQLVVQVVENYLGNNATITQIEAKLDGLCNQLPSPYNGQALYSIFFFVKPPCLQFLLLFA